MHGTGKGKEDAATRKSECAGNVHEDIAPEKVDDHDTPSRPHSPMSVTGSSLRPPISVQHESQPSDISIQLLRTWSRHLSTPSLQFQRGPSIGPVRRGPRNFSMPPDSWAKWPSHTRNERVGPAGEEDLVITRDFAPHTNSDTGDTVVPSERTTMQPKNSLRSTQRSLSDSIGKAMKQGWAKINPIRERQVMRKTSYGAPEGFLEYPELELLPGQGGYRDLEALEDQIETMKHGSAHSENKPRKPSISMANPSLDVRLAQDVHEIRYGADGTKTEEYDVPLSPPPGPITNSASQSFEVLPSHVAYDDRLQNHMLDENNSLKSSKTVVVKRSTSQKVDHTSCPDIASNKVKYMTWHGRPTRQPMLLQSTLDFSAELDDMLEAAREKAVPTVNTEEPEA